MTRATGSQQDNPERVARDALRLLQNGRAQATVGWPEKLLVRLNGLRPELISRALRKKLPIIKPLADHANTGG
ncbi:hypothetical protein [Marinobacterium alkalitolerans]|uniref:hypothetical protein n=1 Tax=Marinobacterium alkalitolerans TaxID=1542925 RepID=UPI001ADD9A5C|nr:hypothetical protein [Marinobacterium alkalitolerans]